MLIIDYIYKAYLRCNKLGIVKVNYSKIHFQNKLWGSWCYLNEDDDIRKFYDVFDLELDKIFIPKFITFLKSEKKYNSFLLNFYQAKQINWKKETYKNLNKLGKLTLIDYLKSTYPTDYLNNAFLWKKSLEGHEYWVGMCDKWLRIVKNDIYGKEELILPHQKFEENKINTFFAKLIGRCLMSKK